MKIISQFRSTLLLLTSLLVSYAAANDEQRDTMYVKDGTIYTAAGEKFVMRGFNEMFVWSSDRTGDKFIPEIDKSGSNALRLVWDHNFKDMGELKRLIENTIKHKMVAIPECHNATGKWGEELRKCVDFWNNPKLIKTIEDNKRWTILNIANEAGDHNVSDKDFIKDYGKAIRDLRSWGYTVPIMLDATTWGQNVDQLLRVGAEMLALDPLKNIIFSTHSYWPAEQSIENYMKVVKAANELGLAMIIGEGPSVTRVGQCDDPNPLPYLEGMKILQEHKVGWLNWSWGGMKNGDCNDFLYFDITKNGMFGHWWHTPGANIVALSPYSVMQTSERPASFYKNGKVKTSGIYLHAEKIEIKVGESIPFQVIVAPVNAENKAYKLSLKGDKKAIKFDKKKGVISGLKPGKVKIIAKAKSGGLSWTTVLNVVE